MEHLHEKTFKNTFIETFPGDHTGNKEPRQTPGMLYATVVPTPVSKPELIGWSDQLAQDLGLQTPDQEDIQVLGGNKVLSSMIPYSACYAGHQFGNWAGQLGDGRAITLGELINPAGKSFELQLKGAGPTPYSRFADGRAVLRSSVREYLMSEAMYHLQVPTTRALALIGTGDQVMRDMFYNGHPEFEPGAIVMRVAPTFLRFGSFEILAARKEIEHLQQLTDWTISHYYPHLTGENRVLLWFREVIEKTAALMVEWLRVGFVHGVMNTDNMSILGLTIDYGPYSFLDAYDPDFTPNTTDLPGKRYAFGKQASVALWNLECLGGAIAPLFKDTEPLIAMLEEYEVLLSSKYNVMMAGKLGLDKYREEDGDLFIQFQQFLSTVQPDMTLFFRALTEMPLKADREQVMKHFEHTFYQPLNAEQADRAWKLLEQYIARIQNNKSRPSERIMKMNKYNPQFILRNYLLHQAIQQMEEGDLTLFKELEEASRSPYELPSSKLLEKRPAWANERAGCSMLSCSS